MSFSTVKAIGDIMQYVTQEQHREDIFILMFLCYTRCKEKNIFFISCSQTKQD